MTPTPTVLRRMLRDALDDADGEEAEAMMTTRARAVDDERLLNIVTVALVDELVTAVSVNLIRCADRARATAWWLRRLVERELRA